MSATDYYNFKTCIKCKNTCSKYLSVNYDWQHGSLNIFQRNQKYKDLAEKCPEHVRIKESK